MTTTPGTIEYDIPSQWASGFVANVSWTPYADASDWRITLTFDGEITNIWSATIAEHTGNTYVIESAAWNGSVDAGETIEFGFEASGSPSDLAFDGDTEPVDPPEILVADASTVEGDAEAPVSTGSVMGPLSTEGNRIVNAAGETVQIEAVNWFGLETDTHAPHGLWTRNWQEMMDEIKEVGFNAIRLPFSLEAVLDPNATPNGIDFSQNPDLEGLSSLEIIDKIVAYAEEIELGIILDNHRASAGDGPNDNGQWFDGTYSEDDWVDAWVMLAERYGESPAIIGADLVNEPHGATWNAWATAAERAGNAVLGVTDNWLILVEGVGSYEGDSYWWGGSLKGVADRPVTLSADDKLVYSPHDYPASVYEQPWFYDGSNLYEVFRENWGFIHEEGIAPILVGEFGSRLETEIDQTWADAIVAYLGGDYDGNGTVDPGANAMSFAWWSWNPNSSDTGGILEDDWRTIRQNAVDLIDPLLDDAGSESSETIRFAVSLSEAYVGTTVVEYATADVTATAGEDYVAKSGSLTFAAGETVKYIDVTVLGDTVAEGDETFVLNTSGPGGTAQAVGTIIDDDGADGPPEVTITDFMVEEQDGWVTLTATLDAPAEEMLRIQTRSEDGTATAGEDYRAFGGRFQFDPGETVATRKFRVYDDGDDEGPEDFFVNLNPLEDAILSQDRIHVTIEDDDDDLPVVTVDNIVVTEGDGRIELTATLSRPAEEMIRIQTRSQDGTAVVDEDFLKVGGRFQFDVGETEATRAVFIRNDQVAEDVEFFDIALNALDDAELAQDKVRVTIIDNDGEATTALLEATSDDWVG